MNEENHRKQPPHLVRNARKLRRKMTLPEVLIWKGFKGEKEHGVVLKRQVPLLGKYIADFLYEPAKIVFEIDGRHIHALKFREDQERDNALTEAGYRVVGISAQSVLRDPDHVIEYIVMICKGELDLG